MQTKARLPIGIENFEDIRRNGYYYVDKTALIKDLLEGSGSINLFTRPRRFGKSLNMNMLKYFFEYGSDPRLFEGLVVHAETQLCEKHMGRYPVISVTLKDVAGNDYDAALGMLRTIIGKEAMRFQFLLDSDVLTDLEKAAYEKLVTIDTTHQQFFSMSQEVLASGLLTLCNLLHKHYGQKVILLIDEYDVPLDKAQNYGYYDQMVSLIRSLFSQALKTNHSLALAVLTGCLRVSRESIFTGLNNLKVLSITNLQSDERFGFTDGEVRAMAEYYGCGDRFDMIKEWYDGYRFGNADVYCPWDVVNYLDLLRSEPDALPRPFWVNTSGNDIIRNFVQMAKAGTRRELESLINGEVIPKKINQELTYRDLYTSIDNLWSILFTTGYLTQRGREGDEVYLLAIPNREIRKIFIDQILEWFQQEARRDAPTLDAFCNAFAMGDAEAVEKQFNAYLSRTISIRDTSVRKNKKENFYHGILLGLLSHREDWYIRSNAESGDGYSDILVESEEEGIGIVIEVKYPDNGNKPLNAYDILEKGCKEALQQIDTKGYEEKLRQDGLETILKYGIACNRKKCRVLLQK
ncbi:MAG: AAA family ATPase [Lachnospiraceae bacterium]|nr:MULTISPECIES: AAA family ATPase [Lachnospiraceae]MCI9221082.1 AAA family ATPase [Lachnospiraceae bacterium]